MIEQHNPALLHGTALAAAFGFSKYKKILDLGGGTAATSIALYQPYRQLRSIIFNLPGNAETARKFFTAANLQNKIEIIASDFKEDELPFCNSQK